MLHAQQRTGESRPIRVLVENSESSLDKYEKKQKEAAIHFREAASRKQ
jgi:hypothetical protein